MNALDFRGQKFKPANKNEIQSFRIRWFDDPIFVGALKKLRSATFGANGEPKRMDEFHRKNAASIDVRRASGANWHSKTRNDMFYHLFEIQPSIPPWIPTYYCDYLSCDLVDLRGYPNDNDACSLVGTHLKGVDLSYSYSRNIGGFQYSTIENSLLVKADFTSQYCAHQYKNSVLQNCRFNNCYLYKTYIEECTFLRCNFRAPESFCACVSKSNFENCSFRSAFLGAGLYIACKFEKCCMIRAQLNTSRFVNYEFVDCEWTPDSLDNPYDDFNTEPPNVEMLSDQQVESMMQISYDAHPFC